MKHTLLLAAVLVGFCGRLFGQTELITNGGFEFGLAGWSVSSGANVSTPTNFVHSGSQALTITTIAGSEQVAQAITLPTNTAIATLTYFYNIFSADGLNVPNASLTVFVANVAGTPVATIDSKLNTDRDVGVSTYHQVSFDLSPYTNTTGGQLQLQFVVTSISTAGTIFSIDDVSVQTATSAGLAGNDNFASPSILTGNTISITSSNVFATKEPGEPSHAGNSGGHSLWWSWTAPASGIVTITTDGSNFDTLLAAYTGNVVSNLTRVAANNDDNGGLSVTSLIKFPVNAGTDYKIAVDGADGATGTIVLALNFVPDTKGPSVSFSSPGAGASVTNTTVTVKGTASDNVAVALVEYRLENAAGTNDYQAAVGTNRWTAVVTNLIPGVNVVRVRAFDTSTNVSTAVARSIYYDIFGPAKGAYAGLFSDTNSVDTTNAGFFSATVAAKGKFTAKLLFAGHTYPFSGQFGFDSTFSNSIVGPGHQLLRVNLLVDLSGGDVITGTVSNNTWAAALSANRAVYSRTHPAPQGPNKYTLVVQIGEDPTTQPGGFGFGTANVDVSGNVTFSGTLGDGTKVSQKTFLSKEGTWPFYVSPYAGQGLLSGWLTFTTDPDSDFNGIVDWVKLPQKSKLYPNGFDFTNGVGVVGSLYHFTNGVPLLALTNGGVISLQGGNLSGPVSYAFSLDVHNRITGTNKLSLTISTANGLFHGTVPNPDTGKPLTVNGALLQSQNAGFGVFSGTNQTGRVDMGN